MNDKSTRVWIALFVALVFVCGLSLGLAAGLWFGPRAVRGPSPGFPWGERRPAPGPRTFAAERFLDRLAREDAQLSAEQRARLEALFEARRREFERVAREMRQRFTAEQERLRAGGSGDTDARADGALRPHAAAAAGRAPTRAGGRPTRRALS